MQPIENHWLTRDRDWEREMGEIDDDDYDYLSEEADRDERINQ